MRTTVFKSVGRGLVLVATVGLGACQAPAGPTAAPPAAPAGAAPAAEGSGPGSDVGSVSFALTLGGGFNLSTISYTISGNGFQRTGTLDVSSTSSFSTVVGGIPVGHGYALSMSSHEASPELDCGASATFDVAAAATTTVPVHMTCQVPHQVVVTPPPAVPVPRSAGLGLAALLAAIGVARLRRNAAR